MGFFSLLGLGGDEISKGFCLFVISFSGISLYHLSRTTKITRLPSFVAGLFYMSAPPVFNHFAEGHFTYLVSYAIAPFVVALFMESVESTDLDIKKLVLTGLIFAFALAQIQFLPMLWALLFLYSIFAYSLKKVILRLKALMIVSAIVILIHLPWILIGVFGTRPEFVGHLAPLELLQALSPTAMDALRLLGGSGRSGWFSFSNAFIGFLAPLIAFFAIILKPRDKMVAYFTLVAVISLFLCKGVNPPLGSIYTWLLFRAPIAGFRDVYHLMFIPTLAYAVLIGTTTERLTELWQHTTKRAHLFCMDRKMRIRLYRNFVARSIVPFLVILIIIASSWLSFSGDFGGTVPVYYLGDDSRSAYEYLAALKGDFRIAWLPMTSVVFSSHSQISGTGRDPMIVFSPKPALDADTAVWHKYFAFQHKTIEAQKTMFAGKILATANVRYVIVRSDTLSHAFTWARIWNQSQILEGQKNLTLVKAFGDIRIFRNDHFLPQIYGTNHVALVSGDLSMFVKLGYTQFMNDELPLLLFTQQLSPHDILLNLVDTLIIQGDNYEDFVFSFVPSEYKLDAGAYANKVVAPFGWTYSGYTWGEPYIDWHYSTQLEDVAITLTNDTLVIPYTAFETTRYEIWAKISFGNKASSLSFSIDDKHLREIVTKTYSTSKFKWVYLGSMELHDGRHYLKIISEIGENAVGKIVIAPSQTLSNAVDSAHRVVQNKHIIVVSEVEDSIKSNDYLTPSDQWGINASEGTGLISLAPCNLTVSLTIPSADHYKLRVRTTNPESINRPANASKSWLIDEFEELNDWKLMGEGQISSSATYKKQGNYSIDWAIQIDKSQTILGHGNDHILYEEFSNEDWSKYDTVSFWICPKTVSFPEPNAQIFFHIRASKDDWYGGNYFIPYNQWTYLQIDMSDWENRSEVNYIRFLVGNSWGEYSDGQKVDFYIDEIRLDKRAKEGNFQWYDVGSTYLEPGRNDINAGIGELGVGTDLLALESFNQTPNANIYPTVRYSEINPTRYVVHVNTTRPFFLVFSENYDPNWKASIDGKTLQHFAANFFANGYYVDEIGEYEIIVEFSLQNLYRIGQVTAVVTFLICLVLVAIPEQLLKKFKLKLFKEK